MKRALSTILLLVLGVAFAMPQTSTKEDELIKLAKTILQKASEIGYSDLNDSDHHFLSDDPEPGESPSDQKLRLFIIENWATSLKDMERNVNQDPERFKGVSYKSFLLKREVDEKGKPIPIVKVHFNVPESAQSQVRPRGTAVIEWRLTFVQNDRPKKDRLKGEPDMLLLRVDLVTPAPPGPF